jgi:hypothetical protein
MQEGGLGCLVGANTLGETSAGTVQARGKPLNSHVVKSQHTPRKCVSVLMCTMSIRLFRMVRTHGECVQPLQSVKLS